MSVNPSVLRETFSQYIDDAFNGIDRFGKTSFNGLPHPDLDNETFYVGTVTPVLHYCMGGISIDTEGSVLDENGTKIPRLHAAGEVTGEVHGDNRLGGHSLLECTVFGSIVGKKIPIKQWSKVKSSPFTLRGVETKDKPTTRYINANELSRHNTPGDCWVAIHGFVYDLTDFAEEHPGGSESVHRLTGTDGTVDFAVIHSASTMDDFDDVKIGVFSDEN